MKGLLVVNGFIKETNFLELWTALRLAADARGVRLDIVGSGELLFDLSTGRPLFSSEPHDFGIFWDKDLKLGGQLEARGLRLFNSVRAISLCDDKALTHAALQNLLPMPHTIAVPMTYQYVGYGDMHFLDTAIEALGLPMIIKECRGSFGKQVYLARTVQEAREILLKRDAVPMLMQEFVAASTGRDIRLYVVGGKVVAAMQRQNNHDFRANIEGGGQAVAYTPTEEEAAMAVRAAEILGLDFAGVDLLFGKDGPLLCEVNSNAHFKGISQSTGVDIAGEIMAHIEQVMKQ